MFPEANSQNNGFPAPISRVFIPDLIFNIIIPSFDIILALVFIFALAQNISVSRYTNKNL